MKLREIQKCGIGMHMCLFYAHIQNNLFFYALLLLLSLFRVWYVQYRRMHICKCTCKCKCTFTVTSTLGCIYIYSYTFGILIIDIYILNHKYDKHL